MKAANIDRRPSGTPAGGQFAPGVHTEAGIRLQAAPKSQSLQTAGPLQRLSLQTFNRDVGFLVSKEGQSHLDLDPPYQRGDVWGPTRRRNLIRSALSGIPIPAIVVNDRLAGGWPADLRKAMYAVVDGKQRAVTLSDFQTDQLDVPASWFPADHVLTATDTDDGPYVSWSGLHVGAQRRFQFLAIPVVEGRLPDLEAERELFELLNYGGVPQGQSDYGED